MSASVATPLLAQLKSLVPAGTGAAPSEQQLQQAQTVLRNLKLELVKSSTTPPFSAEQLPVLLIQREMLEYACFLSLYSKDVKSFERYLNQVKVFYNDYQTVLTPSQNQGPVLGLYLLYLLSQNQIADFHTEYELLCHAAQQGSSSGSSSGPVVPPSPTSSTLVAQNALLSSPYIRFPIQLEAQLMEGCYNQILTAKKAVPLPLFDIFMDTLSETVRNKIADCSELAYASLPISEVQKLLLLPSAAETSKFISHRPSWKVKGDSVSFEAATQAGQKEEGIKSYQLIKQTLDYATELERIV